MHIKAHLLTASRKQISFISVPGHIGIPGNDQVDQAANQATHPPNIEPAFIPTFFDLTYFIRQSIKHQWSSFGKIEQQQKKNFHPIEYRVTKK